MQSLMVTLSMVVGVVLLSLAGCDKSPPKPEKVTVGIINVTPKLNETVNALKKGLTELGWVEGQNIVYVDEGPLGKMGKVEGAVQRLMKKKPDLIVSLTTPVTLKVQKAIWGTKIPVLFAPATDPVASGFVKSLREPGGNFTGIQAGMAEIQALVRLKTMVPDLRRLYVPYNPDDKAMAIGLKGLKKAAAEHNVELVPGEFHSEKDAPRILNDIPDNVQAVWQLPSPFWGVHTKAFVQACIVRKKPLKTHAAEWAEAGAFMAYGLNTRAMGKQMSRLADKILKGHPPATLPVEQPEYFLIINLKTANAIGFEISDNILKQADEVIR